MAELLTCKIDGAFRSDIDLTGISDALSRPGNVVWLDVADPDEHTMALLQEEFGFHPLALEDALRTHERPKIDTYEGYYFLVFYAAHHLPDTGRIVTQALNLFIGENYLVSVHHGPFRQVQETITRWRAPNSPLGNTVGALIYALLDSIVDDYFPLMDEVADQVAELEDMIFERFSSTSIQSIFGLKRDLLGLRRVVAPERDVLNVLLRRETAVFRNEDMPYLQDLYDHVVRVAENIDNYRDLLSSALDSFLSLQSNRLNEVVKVLTITSIVLMSDALIAGIYGMNFANMPELQWQFGYPFALGLMLVVSVALILFFRWKQLL